MFTSQVLSDVATDEQNILLGHEMPDAVAWDAFVFNHPNGSPFHLSAWQRLIHESFGYQAKHIVARSSSGGEICGVLPLFLVRSLLFGRMLISTPQAAYGGILASSPVVEHSICRHAREMAKELRVGFLELRNFRNPVMDDSLLIKDRYVTFRQPLVEDVEANLLAIPRKTRAEVREGIKKGL